MDLDLETKCELRKLMENESGYFFLTIHCINKNRHIILLDKLTTRIFNKNKHIILQNKLTTRIFSKRNLILVDHKKCQKNKKTQRSGLKAKIVFES